MTDLPNTSLAAVFRAPGEPFALERFPTPAVIGTEAIVRIRCTTICTSDLHTYFGRRHSPSPSILGHEMVGELAELGPQGVSDYRGTPLETGDRITWSMVWSCGECFYCRKGLRAKCEKLMKFGHEPITPGRALHGGMAEYCHLPEGTAIFRVPGRIPDVVASPANCATATVAAVLCDAGSVKDEVVVILGAGMLGLTACAMAATAGAACIIAVEPDAQRREAALRFGATAAIDSNSPVAEIVAAIQAMSAGRGADVALEFAGRPETVELGVQLLRIGGRFVLAGSVMPSRAVQLAPEMIVRRMLRLSGVHNYSPEDLEAALSFLSRSLNRYPFEELVGASYPLREVNAAVAHAESAKPFRVALLP